MLLAAFEVLHLPKTKAIVESMAVQVAPDGLCFRFGPTPTEVLYPWLTASICDVRRGRLGVESFVIEDKKRKASRITVTGYEDMDVLLATVEARINDAKLRS